VHLVGCIIGIYYDARTYEYKICPLIIYNIVIAYFVLKFTNFQILLTVDAKI